ncbi:helix-turn-helix domain-containing protein [Phenylobacterium sp. VNQ135]|uniref:helix-turn-helix domain-containing protein n=1 Tax=Phenylobacterium sp. VNQ135 TaxID=3400922 RepID=UPI003BFFEFC4
MVPTSTSTDPVRAQDVANAAHRASVAFILDLIQIGRDGRHPLDALLLSTIVQANVATISGRADLQVEFAGAETPPPDELRRPVSMNALASSLRLPFESVRRRVHGLARSGLCQITRDGVIVPTEILTHPDYLTGAMRAFERLRQLHADMRGIGALEGLPPPSVGLAGGLMPVRTVARVVSDYMLRAMDVAHTEFGDVIACLLLFEIFRANTEHVGATIAPELAQADGLLDDRHRKPVRRSDLARRLGLPAETVRRHVLALQELGYIEARQGGLIVTAYALRRPRVVRFAAENAVHLRRMFAQLSQLGVLAIWNDYAAAQAASA